MTKDAAMAVIERMGLQGPVVKAFVDALMWEDGLSLGTAQSYSLDVFVFWRWLEGQGAGACLLQARDDQVLGHVLWLAQDRQARSVNRSVSALRRFYRWALREGLVDADASIGLFAVRVGAPPKRAARLNLTQGQAQRLLEMPDTSTFAGLRDRAMLELMYGCGLRVSELVDLAFCNLLLGERFIRLVGKGRRERIVPLGEHAMLWLTRYIEHGRPWAVGHTLIREVFLSISKRSAGRKMTRYQVWALVRGCGVGCGLGGRVSPHMLRHAYATHMYEGGARLEVLQLLLGHACVGTTALYIALDRAYLRQLWDGHHPRSGSAKNIFFGDRKNRLQTAPIEAINTIEALLTAARSL